MDKLEPAVAVVMFSAPCSAIDGTKATVATGKRTPVEDTAEEPEMADCSESTDPVGVIS